MGFDFPHIDPVAFWVGPLPVRWYALAYLAGFLLAWRYCLWLTRAGTDTRPNAADIDDFISPAVLGVILGGRLGYVLFYNLPHYLNNPVEIFMPWLGGMSFHGGALGVILAMYIFARLRKIEFLRLSDVVCAGVPIGLCFGRIANFINGELFGRVTDLPWGVRFPHGGGVPRHPSQLYESALEGVVLFLILFVMIRMPAVRERPGIVAGSFLAIYGLFRALIELVRVPDEQIGYLWGMITMGQVLCLPMIVAGGALIVHALLKNKPHPAMS